MPNRPLHRELNELMGIRDPDMEVQRLMDSTAHAHGPAHRGDPVHSPAGAVLELLKAGKATPNNVAAVFAHVGQDRAVDEIMRVTGLRGPARQFVKGQFERYAVAGLRRLRRR